MKRVGAKTIVYFLTCACVDYFATALAQAPADPGDGVVVVALREDEAGTAGGGIISICRYWLLPCSTGRLAKGSTSQA